MTTIDGKSPNLALETKAIIRDLLMEPTIRERFEQIYHDLLMEPAIRERLEQICPDAFCDGDLQMDLLLEAMGKYHTTEDIKELVVDENERYEFRWSGKQKAKYESQKSSTGTLRPCPEESKNWDTTQNLYIEGDNLEVLKILKRAYAGKIKMIYIDPPYNTGKDFVYKDDYTDNLKNYLEQTGQLTAEGKAKSSNTTNDGRFHTNWLNMMYPRLRLARELLSDDGVIFISIDDNEQANLKKLCDEVFLSDNFVSQVIWSLGTGTQAGHFVRAHESILTYFKSKTLVPNFNGGNGIIEHSALKKISKKNPASIFVFKAGTRWDAPDNTELRGTWGTSEKTTLVSGRMICKNKQLVEDVELSAGWAMKDQMKSYFNNIITYDSKGQLVKSFYFNKNGILRYEKERSIINPPTIIKDIASTKNGTDELFSLFNTKLFDFPKPINLIKYLLNLNTEPDSIILDFFSGSASTAHAVIQLNAEDDKNRKFITIQLPECINLVYDNKGLVDDDINNNAIDFLNSIHRPHNLCEIGKERIRRAGEKIIEEAKKAGKDVSNLDVGFKVFKLSESNMNKWHLELADLKDKNDMEKAAIAALRAGKNTIRRKEIEAENEKRKAEGLAPFDIDLCVIYEWLLKYGVMPDCRITTAQVGGHKVYSVSGGAFMICLEHGLNLDWAQALVTYRDECLSGMDDATKSDAWHVMVADACFDSTIDMQNVAKTLHDSGLKEEHWIVV